MCHQPPLFRNAISMGFVQFQCLSFSKNIYNPEIYMCFSCLTLISPPPRLRLEKIPKYDNILLFGRYPFSNNRLFNISTNSDKNIQFNRYVFILLFAGKAYLCFFQGSVNTGSLFTSMDGKFKCMCCFISQYILNLKPPK